MLHVHHLGYFCMIRNLHKVSRTSTAQAICASQNRQSNSITSYHKSHRRAYISKAWFSTRNTVQCCIACAFQFKNNITTITVVFWNQYTNFELLAWYTVIHSIISDYVQKICRPLLFFFFLFFCHCRNKLQQALAFKKGAEVKTHV